MKLARHIGLGATLAESVEARSITLGEVDWVLQHMTHLECRPLLVFTASNP
ncbi:MAG: hypothetical protein P8I59_01715 [Pseudomonadales bacterium]|nr:hypothetical protein [Pseudomonadales bacterium]